MSMRLLVAVDGSEQSLEAVNYVGEIVRRVQVHMEVELFHVLSRIPEAYYDFEMGAGFDRGAAEANQSDTPKEPSAKEFMARARDLLVNAGVPEDSIEVNIHDREIGIARDIVRESTKGISAVVAGRTGKSEVKDILLGSIATKLIGRLQGMPVWVVGGKPDPGKILVALDGSEGSMKAVDHVAQMLGDSDFEVLLLSVIREPDTIAGGPQGESVPLGIRTRFVEEAKERMLPVFEDAQARLVRSGFSPDRIHIDTETGARSRAWTIVDMARKQGYGTVVVGRRGLSKVDEFFLGRVSNKVVQMATDLAVWVVS